MDSYSEARHYLEEFDDNLGQEGLELEGVLIGQVALWEYADRAGVDIEGRETDDIDIYVPDVLQAFDIAELYDEVPQQTGTRLNIDRVPDTYMDLIWDHPMADTYIEAMESGEAEKVEGLDNIDLYILPEEDYIESKTQAGREKDFSDIDKMQNVMASGTL